MRVLGLDVGLKRVGIAISDVSGTLARPLTTIVVTAADVVDRVAAEVCRLAAEDDGLGSVVVGMPRHLDGTPSDHTLAVERFVAALRLRVPVPVEVEDERLSSREAESRLAVRERDWKKRKARLDAAAAAVILQDHLDRKRRDDVPRFDV
jgi:putative Holliday junction resolvase